MNYKKFLLIILILICLVVFLVTSYVLLKDFKNFKENNNSNENLILETIEINEETQEKTIDWNYLKSINENIIGWIEIEGTKINYPILQDNGNLYYLRHNYNKKYISSGSIFTMNVNPFKDQETTIYGHNMKNGTMFTSLMNYKSKEYFEKHPNIRFTTTINDNTYEIISAFESKVYNDDENAFKYYNFINANNEEEFNNFITNIKKLSIYDTGKTAQYGDELMTLSTCAYHTKNGRFVVVAKKLK